MGYASSGDGPGPSNAGEMTMTTTTTTTVIIILIIVIIIMCPAHVFRETRLVWTAVRTRLILITADGTPRREVFD